MNDVCSHLKLVAMNRSMAVAALRSVERKTSRSFLQVGPEESDKDSTYYPQFDEAIRAEAAVMAEHYELFYCLEKSIRGLVVEKLKAEVGAEWWTKAVPENVRQNAEKNRQRELDSAMTARSQDPIDYTTFGELGEIVRQNWPHFGDTFNSQKGFDRVMASLNLLRGPIAHCCPLASDEVDRLQLTLRDWFRLME